MAKTAIIEAAASDRVVTSKDNAPDPFDALTLHADSLYEEVGHWADGAEIENDKQAEAVDRLLIDVKDLITACEEARDAEIKPLTAQVTTIRERYYPLVGETKAITGKAIRAKKVLLDVKTAWGRKVALRQAAEAQRLREAATKAAQEAAQAARDASGDLAATESAEALLTGAQIALRQAKGAESATVAGMRANWIALAPATPEAETVLLRHYWQTNRPAIVAAALELARQDVRAGKRQIPGVVIENQPRAV
jgi:hypothetical protein